MGIAVTNPIAEFWSNTVHSQEIVTWEGMDYVATGVFKYDDTGNSTHAYAGMLTYPYEVIAVNLASDGPCGWERKRDDGLTQHAPDDVFWFARRHALLIKEQKGNAEISRLSTEARSELERLGPGGPVNRRLCQAAEEHNVCSEFDDLMVEVGLWGRTHGDWWREEKDYNVTVEVEVTLQVTVPVTALSEDCARDQIDSSGVLEALINDHSIHVDREDINWEIEEVTEA
jgi:hypothetical protein